MIAMPVEEFSRRDAELCPYWHQVASDFVSVYPAGATASPDATRNQDMAGKTLEEVCAMEFAECEGYQRVLAEEEEGPARPAVAPPLESTRFSSANYSSARCFLRETREPS